MRSFTLMTTTEAARRRSLLAALVAASIALSACGGDDGAVDEAADSSTTDEVPTESVPFVDDEVDAIADDELREDPFEDDDTDAAPDVAPENPLSEEEIAALLEEDATAESVDSADEDIDDDAGEEPVDSSIVLGQPEDDPTHVGRIEATAEALMRELALAYGGSGELLAEPERDAEGGSMVFALTELPDGNNFRVDVEFSYVADVDQPDMIVGHQAERITLTPFSSAG